MMHLLPKTGCLTSFRSDFEGALLGYRFSMIQLNTMIALLYYLMSMGHLMSQVLHVSTTANWWLSLTVLPIWADDCINTFKILLCFLHHMCSKTVLTLAIVGARSPGQGRPWQCNVTLKSGVGWCHPVLTQSQCMRAWQYLQWLYMYRLPPLACTCFLPSRPEFYLLLKQ